MLARQLDGADWVKVVDFGIAKSVASPGEGGGGQTVTTAGVSLGTPEYMSPEQLAGEKLDPRTDIYSLGLVLFNMLTGQLPYPKLTSKETLVRRLTSPPATLTDVRPDVSWPAAVQAVLSRALDPEPDRRYASVADFGRAITAAGGIAGRGRSGRARCAFPPPRARRRRRLTWSGQRSARRSAVAHAQASGRAGPAGIVAHPRCGRGAPRRCRSELLGRASVARGRRQPRRVPRRLIRRRAAGDSATAAGASQRSIRPGVRTCGTQSDDPSPGRRWTACQTRSAASG